ncbi:MAG: histidine kinase [Mahellales bacterium]
MRERVVGIAKSMARLTSDAFKVKSLRSIIALSITLITIVSMLLVSIALYNKFSKTAEENAAISTQQVMEQVHINLEHYLKTMIEISNHINFKIYMSDQIPNEDFNRMLDVLTGTRDDIVTLALFSDSGQLVAAAPLLPLKKDVNVTHQNWFIMAEQKPHRLFFSAPHVQNLFKGQHNWVVSLSRNITFYAMDQGMSGVLLVDMNFRAIDQLCSKVSLGKRGYIYIMDAYGNIIYHPQQQLVYMGLKEEDTQKIMSLPDGSYLEPQNGEKCLVTIKTVNYTGWKMVGVSYMEEMVATRKEINVFLVWIVVFGILFAIFISLFISARISKPIKRLERSMMMVQDGRFDINIDVRGDDEVEHLSKTFNIMVARIRQLMKQIVTEQEAKRKNEFAALQAQINPHFLYNTLDSVVWMAENGEDEGVITMVTSLARLFRISISRGNTIIPLWQELEHAKNYLIIQKMRYKNKFDYEIYAQQEVLECQTLKLVLQPLIENAIYHGIEPMADKGMIEVSAAAVGQRLLLRVKDNGVGMDDGTLKGLLDGRVEGKTHSGMGIKNVHDRIQLYFGREFGLDIESVEEEGTTVKVWLPIDWKEGR